MSTKTRSLRTFMLENREELEELCLVKMKQKAPERTEASLPDELRTVIDEIIRALGREQGLPESSPLPGKSAAAARRGRRRKQLGSTIDKISYDFGSISDAIGEIGRRRGVSFDAADYQVFNLCVDAAVAAALEAYWDEARDEAGYAASERVGFLAHELRNALASAQMAFATLKRAQLSVNSRTGDVLGRGLSRLENLISQALLAVKLNSAFKLESKRIKVASLLHDIEDAAGPQRDISVIVDADDALEIEADEELLTSAISNLLQNALKFSHPAGTVILRGRADGDSVLIEVADECGGLPPGKQEELFEPFVQRSQNRRGLGLGLAITREAVGAHGGTLTVRDLPGKGCIFAVKLRARGGTTPTSAF